MDYKVVKYFTDLCDDGFAYHTGDTFPRVGASVTAERIKELSTKNNKRGIPLIQRVKVKKNAD